MQIIVDSSHLHASAQPLYNQLLGKSTSEEPIAILREFMSVLVENVQLFDSLYKLSQEPLLSFADLCCQTKQLPTETDKAASEQRDTTPRPIITPAPPPRRSARIALKRQPPGAPREPLSVVGRSAGSSNVVSVRKRKRTTNDDHLADEQETTGEVTVPSDSNRPSKPKKRQSKRARRH